MSTDALNTMEAEASIIDGTGSQFGIGSVSSRWGDYTSMSVDPADGCTFWYTNEYLTAGDSHWHTRIASFKFLSCAAAAHDFNGDGKADILWRNTATGDVALFLMNGLTLVNSALISNINPDWSVVGVGDFNGDGKADILWRN